MQELTDTIVAQSGATKRFTESFLRELVQVIQEYLEKDGVVKVKGLGTFKLIWNEPRKSVDVSTGNTIVLPGHYKVTFIPDNEVKEKINAPYAHLETVMGGAEVISEVEESGELIVEKGEVNPLQVESSTDDVLLNRKIDEPLTIKREPSDVDTDSPTHQITDSPERSDISTDSPEHSDINTASPSKKKWWVIMVVLMLLCLLGAAGYYWKDVLLPQRNTPVATQTKVPVVVVQIDTIDDVITDTIAADKWEQEKTTLENDSTPVIEVPVDTIVELTLENYTYQDALNAPVRDTVTVIDGSRLTMVAYRAFGHKAFWVYVYDANRNVLTSPNAVEKGMKLVIPDLPLSIVNPKSKLCIDKALELAKQY
ncbi:MAG: HU family DNA-binding protein [Paludibacteraceae bacterium]|nr:HU family DNA-binding protein [Paludibacteraceae bacterium]